MVLVWFSMEQELHGYWFFLLIRLKQAQKIVIVRYKNKGAFKSSDSVNMYKIK